MKKIIISLLVLFLLAASFTPAIAADGGARRGPRGTFALVGLIDSIDLATDTVYVEVIRGNKLVQPYIGQILAIKTTATTRFRYKDGTTVRRISIEDLKVGDPVSVNGILARGVWKARRITVGAKINRLR